MRVAPAAIRGVRLIDGGLTTDERGSARKILRRSDLTEDAAEFVLSEVLTTRTSLAGTVRGLHYQVEPVTETKILWVVQGQLFDVLVDLRINEPTYGDWSGVVLTADSDRALLVPPGVAHGFQTLVPETAVTYLIDAPYSPAHARSLRWEDPSVGVDWPLPVTAISARDEDAPLWPPAAF